MTHPHFDGEHAPWRHCLTGGAWWSGLDIAWLTFIDGSQYKYWGISATDFLNLRDAGDPRGTDRGTWFNLHCRGTWRRFVREPYPRPTQPTPDAFF